jgi:hypothetical protein
MVIVLATPDDIRAVINDCLRLAPHDVLVVVRWIRHCSTAASATPRC